MQDNNKIRTPSQQEIIDAIGNTPISHGSSAKPRNKIAFLLGFVGLGFVLLGSLAILLSGTDKNDSLITPSQSTINGIPLAYAQIADSTTEIVGFIATLEQNTYGDSLKSFIHPESAMRLEELSRQDIKDYVGTDVDWSSCGVIQADEYRTATLPRARNEDGYDITYVPVQCGTISGGVRELEFDMRRSSKESPKIFDIIVRVL